MLLRLYQMYSGLNRYAMWKTNKTILERPCLEMFISQLILGPPWPYYELLEQNNWHIYITVSHFILRLCLKFKSPYKACINKLEQKWSKTLHCSRLHLKSSSWYCTHISFAILFCLSVTWPILVNRCICLHKPMKACCIFPWVVSSVASSISGWVWRTTN